MVFHLWRIPAWHHSHLLDLCNRGSQPLVPWMVLSPFYLRSVPGPFHWSALYNRGMTFHGSMLSDFWIGSTSGYQQEFRGWNKGRSHNISPPLSTSSKDSGSGCVSPKNNQILLVRTTFSLNFSFQLDGRGSWAPGTFPPPEEIESFLLLLISWLPVHFGFSTSSITCIINSKHLIPSA